MKIRTTIELDNFKFQLQLVDTDKFYYTYRVLRDERNIADLQIDKNFIIQRIITTDDCTIDELKKLIEIHDNQYHLSWGNVKVYYKNGKVKTEPNIFFFTQEEWDNFTRSATNVEKVVVLDD